MENTWRKPILFNALLDSIECGMLVMYYSWKGGLGMTYIQTLWAKHLEDKRSHQAQEALTKEQNVETQRSHRANEALTNKQLDETIRHQIAQDTEIMLHDRITEAEIAKHNRETEAIMRMENAIKAQANQLSYAAQHERNVTQAETERLKNSTNEMLGMLKNRVDQQQLEVAKKNLDIQFAKLGQENERIDQEWENLSIQDRRAKSEAFKNYSSGIHEVVNTATDLVSLGNKLPNMSESPNMVVG